MSIRIERLAAHHERKNFDCGETPLNEFLHKQAGQQQRRGFGKTYVTDVTHHSSEETFYWERWRLAGFVHHIKSSGWQPARRRRSQ